MKRLIMTAALFLSAVAAAGCGEKSGPGSTALQRPVIEGAVVVEVRARDVDDYYRSTGTVVSRTTAVVSSKLMGEVKKLYAQAGDRVTAGTTLLAISSPDIAAKARAAEEAVHAAENEARMAEENEILAGRTFDRFQKLYEGRAVTDQEFDEVSTRHEVARLEHERARKSLRVAEALLDEARAYSGYTEIASPISGIVAERHIEEGSMASPGVPLFTIEEPIYRVEVPVDERFTVHIRPGTPATVTLVPLGDVIEGTVSEVVHQIDPATRTFIVKINMSGSGSDLRGGMYAEAAFPVGTKQVLYVPAESIVKRGDLTAVYTVNREGVTSLRLVRTGRELDSSVEIISGLSADEKIIARDVSRMVDGGILAGAQHREQGK